mmetsp:Transcript_33442/g.108205  ORF Transcript_33442/g.108205 Transcript_33442/m.108205 type:complete len:302 (+) Transcript_33442:2943-3848(+)
MLRDGWATDPWKRARASAAPKSAYSSRAPRSRLEVCTASAQESARARTQTFAPKRSRAGSGAAWSPSSMSRHCRMTSSLPKVESSAWRHSSAARFAWPARKRSSPSSMSASMSIASSLRVRQSDTHSAYARMTGVTTSISREVPAELPGVVTWCRILRHSSSDVLHAEVLRAASTTRCKTAGVDSPSAHLVPCSFCCACATKGSTSRLYLPSVIASKDSANLSCLRHCRASCSARRAQRTVLNTHAKSSEAVSRAVSRRSNQPRGPKASDSFSSASDGASSGSGAAAPESARLILSIPPRG